ncbi:MAG: hypothetical protein IV100_28245 [Myxococcales bacterium]|nr:hypothetical protein [Myxococcales bacterium]
MALLIASVVALGLGPLLVSRGQRYPWLFAAVDLGIPLVLLAFVALEIAPEAWELAGALSLAALAVGAFLPSVFERLFSPDAAGRFFRSKEPNDPHPGMAAALFLGLLGLAIHAAFDGAALAVDAADHDHGSLGWGVVLHRVSDGASVVWLSQGRLGPRGGWFGIGLIGAATVLGYVLANAILPFFTTRAAGLLLALLGGTLLHVTLGHSKTLARLLGHHRHA